MKAKAEWEAIIEYGRDTLKFSPEDIMGIKDHRIAILMRKAYLFDKKASTKGAVEAEIKGKAKTAPTLKPGSTPKSGPSKTNAEIRADRAAKRLESTGDVNDFAAWLQASGS